MYAGNDPLNLLDPDGLQRVPGGAVVRARMVRRCGGKWLGRRGGSGDSWQQDWCGSQGTA
jgi:hypothetical protein